MLTAGGHQYHAHVQGGPSIQAMAPPLTSMPCLILNNGQLAHQGLLVTWMKLETAFPPVEAPVPHHLDRRQTVIELQVPRCELLRPSPPPNVAAVKRQVRHDHGALP